MDETIVAQAEAVFDTLKDECTGDEILNWLGEISGAALEHMYALEELQEDEVSDEDRALMAVIEPMLFLLGLALKNEWVGRMENEH